MNTMYYHFKLFSTTRKLKNFSIYKQACLLIAYFTVFGFYVRLFSLREEEGVAKTFLFLLFVFLCILKEIVLKSLSNCNKMIAPYTCFLCMFLVYLLLPFISLMLSINLASFLFTPYTLMFSLSLLNSFCILFSSSLFLFFL